MHDASLLHILDTLRELPDELGNLRLWQDSLLLFLDLLLDELVQFLCDAVLHKQVDILIVLKEMVQFGNIRTVIELSVDHDLLPYPLSQILLPQVLFVNDFQRVCFL